MSKEDLDLINYGGKLSENSIYIENDKPYLKDYSMSETVKNEFSYIKEALESINQNKAETEKYHIGAISVGAHTVDYEKIYGFKVDDSWNKTPVMFVFENPSNNIDASFAGNMEEAIAAQVSEDLVDWNKLLCKVVWHADYGIAEYKNGAVKYGEGIFQYFEKQKVYSELLLSMILEFKLANFYTTNIFRYEIFQNINGKENFQNLDNVGKISNEISEFLYNLNNEKSSFTKELEAFGPKIIFTTSKPYNILKEYCEKNDIELVKLPHPAHPSLPKAHRFCTNVMSIIGGLHRVKVIDDNMRNEKLVKAMKRYENLKDDMSI